MTFARAFMRTIGLAVLLLTAIQLPAKAHGDLTMEFDTCVLRVGLNRVHFTGYQPTNTQQEFCEDIPETGRTIIVLDYFDPVLRDMLTEFRVIRDEGADENGNLDKVTVVHLPPAKHPNGTFNFEYEFPKGRFIGLLTVKNENLQYKARFPFGVGLVSPRSSNLPFYGLVALLVGAVVAYWLFWVRGRRPPSSQAAVISEGWMGGDTPADGLPGSKPSAGS